MLKIDKLELGKNCDGLYVITNEGVISITKIDADIFIRPDTVYGINDNYLNRKDFYTFKITKEDQKIYNIFEELYNAVKVRKPYNNSIYEFPEKDYILPEYVDINKESKLFIDNKVQWHSDEYKYDESSVLIIDKKEDYLDISFKKSMETENLFPTFTVKVTNASPRYYHFSQTFMDMYKKLDAYYEQTKEKGYQRVRKIL